MYGHRDVDLYYIIYEINHRSSDAELQQLDGGKIMAPF